MFTNVYITYILEKILSNLQRFEKHMLFDQSENKLEVITIHLNTFSYLKIKQNVFK
jgi:hypothetical protein